MNYINDYQFYKRPNVQYKPSKYFHIFFFFFLFFVVVFCCFCFFFVVSFFFFFFFFFFFVSNNHTIFSPDAVILLVPKDRLRIVCG